MGPSAGFQSTALSAAAEASRAGIMRGECMTPSYNGQSGLPHPYIRSYGISRLMAKPNSQERRKQVLKERKAEEQREAEREEAKFLFGDARRAHREGDLPAADRYLKKALILDPDHAPSLNLLAQIHESAGHH